MNTTELRTELRVARANFYSNPNQETALQIKLAMAALKKQVGRKKLIS
jgi:hypothetical protein